MDFCLLIFDSSIGKEFTCNARDPSLIPGSGRSPGKGIGYPLQYSWASLVAQLVKNLPAIRDTLVQSLGWEDLLEKGMATHSSILAWRNSMRLQSQTQLNNQHFYFFSKMQYTENKYNHSFHFLKLSTIK